MPNKAPPNDESVPFITGGDWSVGINSPTSLSQAEVLALLGRGLQTLYGNVVDEGVPQHLAGFVERLETKFGSPDA